MGTVSCQLYRCHPLRNFFIPVESYYRHLLDDFRQEMLRLFVALGASWVSISMKFSSASDQKASAELGVSKYFTGGGAGGISEDLKIFSDINKSYGLPTSDSKEQYTVQNSPWFFLAESSTAIRTEYYGLDFSDARNGLLQMKQDRIANGGEIGCDKRLITFEKSEEFESHASGKEIFVQWAKSLTKKVSFKLEYETRVHRWNPESCKWEANKSDEATQKNEKKEEKEPQE